MQKFILVGFRGHPAIVKEMSLFMITERVDPSKLDGLNERLKRSEQANKDLAVTVKTLDTNYALIKRLYDNAVNDIKWLNTKVE